MTRRRYSLNLAALVIGFVVWRELPSASVLGGAAVVIASGLYVMHRERVKARAG